ncbi:MAG TPA: tetratricopeptide repeat protein [Pirellulales bacterium]|nr:tetratricopeptide repeat protein [Pirellulales bacterium]
MPARLGATFFLSAALALPGCAQWRSRAHLDYRTIQADPHHDSELAKTENQRAITLLEKGKMDKAEQALQQALIADVTYGPAHNNLGKIYFSQGKYYLAAWEFEYAAKLMPHRVECQNNIGLVYEAVGKLDEAVDVYTSAYQMNDKNPVIIGNLARARVRRGDCDPAIQQLLADLRLYDDRPDWVAWANERLALGPPPTGHLPLQTIKANEDGLPEDTPHADELEVVPAPQADKAFDEELLPTWRKD